jgi:hypothetical protein
LLQWKKEVVIGDVHFLQDNLKWYDKSWTLQRAREVGFPVPTTWERYEDIPSGDIEIFFKPRSEGDKGTRSWVSGKRRIPAYARGSRYLFQERIRSQGTYGFGFLASEGRTIASHQHFERFSMPKDGGSAAVIMSAHEERLEELCSRLIGAALYNGWGLIEAKWCPNRSDFVLMELNAKLWASLEFAFRREPAFLRSLFHFEAPRETLDGLVWPSRLIRSGARNLLAATPALVRYQRAYDPVTTRELVRSVTPNWLAQAWRRRPHRGAISEIQ